jgi:hypothetical protein
VLAQAVRRILQAGSQWLTPVILASQEAELRKIAVGSQTWANTRPYLEKTQHKKGMVEWLKG